MMRTKKDSDEDGKRSVQNEKGEGGKRGEM